MKEGLKVLMTADTLGGVWIYALQLSRALAPFGVEIYLATMGRRLEPHQWTAAAAIPNLTVYESDYRLEWMPEAWGDVDRAGDWLQGLAYLLQPDLVHHNGFAHAALAWPCPSLVVCHSCVRTWWRSVLREAPPEDTAGEYTRRVRAGLAAADHVVGITQAHLAVFLDEYECRPSCSVIYNGLYPHTWLSRQKEPIILASGRIWDQGKNLGLLCAEADHLNWPVFLAGENRNPDSGEEVDTEKVHFLGMLPRTDLLDWLARAGIFVLPALYEPFGFSALEAAQAGCALVLADLPTLREIWGDTALYFPPRDGKALVDAVNRLCTQAELRERLALAAAERAGRYHADRMGGDYFRLYQRLLARRPQTGRRFSAAP